MMPVVRGKSSTRVQILSYSLALIPTSFLPVAVGIAGPLYGVVAGVMVGAMVWQSVAVLREQDEVHEPRARKLFLISILYLFALFAALIGERVIKMGLVAG